ncbi:MAG: hypothetical protein J6R32_02255 [Bacteroidales bacterium]|nr:hypothetical protein [Bacteroidales bacterium]
MTLKTIIDLILEVAGNRPNIKTVREGNVYDLNDIPDVEYGVFYVTQGTHSFSQETITYNLNLFYIDRLTPNLDNRLQIQSDGITEIQNILLLFAETYDVEIEYNANVTAFNQRFADDCAGVFVTVQITDVNDFGVCGIN